jgi:excisionase family DNA binding protein
MEEGSDMNILNDVKTTCELLSMSRSALYEAMASGLIHAVKNGRKTLFHRDEIERFAASLPTVH